MKRKANDLEMSFEKAMEKLEAIVETLEKGELPLDESVTAFKEGIRLSKLCSNKLNQTQEEIKKVIEDDQGGYRLELFTEGDEK